MRGLWPGPWGKCACLVRKWWTQQPWKGLAEVGVFQLIGEKRDAMQSLVLLPPARRRAFSAQAALISLLAVIQKISLKLTHRFYILTPR